jgi:hypothetical protein
MLHHLRGDRAAGRHLHPHHQALRQQTELGMNKAFASYFKYLLPSARLLLASSTLLFRYSHSRKDLDFTYNH